LETPLHNETLAIVQTEYVPAVDERISINFLENNFFKPVVVVVILG